MNNIFTHAVISDLTKNADGSSTFMLSKPGEPEVFSVTTPPNVENIREWLHTKGEELKERQFEEDMKSRDQGAKIFESGAFGLINLHANLDNREIHRCIERYKGMDVTFFLDESDSTPAQRRAFRRLWESAGGPYIARDGEEAFRMLKGTVN